MKGGTRKRGKTWSYYFDTAQINGKRKKIEKGGFRTKKEAETALAKAIAEYENSGQVFQPSTISVSDYLDFWYEQYCKMNLTENTQQTYATLIHRHLKPQCILFKKPTGGSHSGIHKPAKGAGLFQSDHTLYLCCPLYCDRLCCSTFAVYPRESLSVCKDRYCRKVGQRAHRADGCRI